MINGFPTGLSIKTLNVGLTPSLPNYWIRAIVKISGGAFILGYVILVVLLLACLMTAVIKREELQTVSESFLDTG